MDKFIINGPCKAIGQIRVAGSKNAALPILAATLLFDAPVELINVPNVRDTRTMFDLLRSLNKKIIVSKNKKKVKIYNSKKKISTFCSYSIVKQMRASILALPGLISKHRTAVISAPGGCAIGTRPINYHLSGLKKLGMKYVLKKGYIHATAKQGLKPNDITFKKISVGATESLLIASTLCRGTVFLRGVACEPEVKDLCKFLISAGAKIKWIGKRTIKVEGVKKLNSTSYSIMGDRIEAISWAALTVLTGGKIKIGGFKNIKLLKTELDLLKKIGASIKYKEGKIEIKGKSKLKSVNLETKEYPGFSTDAGPLFGILLCKANGRSIFTENIFENRLNGWVAEVRRLGAKIQLKGNKAIIEGNTKFQGAEELMSSDLRASVALCLAAISSSGRSVVSRIYMLERGMENFEKKARRIGVNIKRIS